MITEFPTINFTRKLVPNFPPCVPVDSSRIAIIGEAPGEEEENYGQPFIGRSGQILNGVLRDVGIDRNASLVGNVCQARPPGNDIANFEWQGTEISDGLKALRSDLVSFSPHICILVGNSAIHAAKFGAIAPKRKGRVINWPCKIGDWCSSLFRASEPSSPFRGFKCIPAFHPAGVLRFWGMDGNYPRMKAAFKRAKEESFNDDLILPNRRLRANLFAGEAINMMDSWPAHTRCSLDIEGGLPRDMVNVRRAKPKKGQRPFGWPCVSLSSHPSNGRTLVWSRYSESELPCVIAAFARLLFRLDVPKVLQNQLYDNFVLSFGYGIPIRNVLDDVMIKGWAIFAELPRSLGVQASVWTREPHWKDDSMYESDGEGLYVGCARDSAVTFEVNEAQDNFLAADASERGHSRRIEHYRAVRSIQDPFLYMEVRGIHYDNANVLKMLGETETKMLPVRERLKLEAGYDLCGKTSLSDTKLPRCLYEEKGYEKQYKKEGGRKTEKATTDIEALLTLMRHHPGDPFLADIAQHRHLEGVRETLQIEADPDGRVRCGYSLEAETGRVKCYKSPTGSGANMQTIQKDLRGNYAADPGYDFAQADLEGADGWTVAAHCARLGDKRMLEDYLAGMKPAKIIALMYWFGQEINRLDIESVKNLHRNVFPIVKKLVGDWLYMGCKRVYHGTDYMMGIPTMQLNVLKDSFKESGVPVFMEHRDARYLQEGCMLARYTGVRLWHTWAESILRTKGELESASGHIRVFFGRRFGKDVNETLKQFLAHEPQMNTTWATNLAMLRLWNDKANRVVWVDKLKFLYKTGDGAEHYWSGPLDAWLRIWPGALLVEPLHQVHDALCVQWPIFLRQWARGKMKEWFNNPLKIAGIDLVIPFDGTFGPSWGNMPHQI